MTGTRTPAPPSRGRRDASMTLLTQLMNDTLDPGYAHAAERKRASGTTGPTGGGAILLAGLVVVGVLFATAAAEARERSGASTQARDRLTAEIDRRTASLDAVQRSVESLRADVTAARQEALSLSPDGFLLQRLSSLESLTGLGPVEGPGIEVTVDDAPGIDEQDDTPRTGGEPSEEADGRVLDYDLQRLVNGLWEAGADAVAVNGRRLTSLSAIRAAGRAVLVDYRPLSPPYVVQAVGDPDQLESRFADTSGGRYVQSIKESYGVRFEMRSVEKMRLTGASGVTLRHAAAAEPAGTPTGSTPAARSAS
jgi:uncharacterized protein YlxW (UPF0749 family)